MTKIIIALILLSFICPVVKAQNERQKAESTSNKINIPMDPLHWEHDSTKVKFEKHQSVMAAKPVKGPYDLLLKDREFSSGIIEFDIALTGQGFPGIFFRMSHDKQYGENFYIRSFGNVNPELKTSLHYTALIDGIAIWDLTDEYQSGAKLFTEGWNHVKLDVRGKQMKVYVNDDKPALIVPMLEGAPDVGRIMLTGDAVFANFSITPYHGENNPFVYEGDIYSFNDPRYLQDWEVSGETDFPFGKDVSILLPGRYERGDMDFPDSSMNWSNIKAGHRAIVNLTEKFGKPKKSQRRLAWLRTSIYSENDQSKTLRLGFNDEIWLFINGELLHVDKNLFGTPSQKVPNGRCTIENSKVVLPLKKGENEILVGLANYFYGWGLIARFDNTEGIRYLQE